MARTERYQADHDKDWKALYFQMRDEKIWLGGEIEKLRDVKTKLMRVVDILVETGSDPYYPPNRKKAEEAWRLLEEVEALNGGDDAQDK
jgi:hypothetical protein